MSKAQTVYTTKCYNPDKYCIEPSIHLNDIVAGMLSYNVSQCGLSEPWRTTQQCHLCTQKTPEWQILIITIMHNTQQMHNSFD